MDWSLNVSSHNARQQTSEFVPDQIIRCTVAPKVDPTISTLTNPLNVDQNEASASTGSERSSRPLRFRSNDDDSLHS